MACDKDVGGPSAVFSDRIAALFFLSAPAFGQLFSSRREKLRQAGSFFESLPEAGQASGISCKIPARPGNATDAFPQRLHLEGQRSFSVHILATPPKPFPAIENKRE
ncbi:MAG TPA: hypothetical protein VGV07_14725 [Devosia sp.]|jgi:hypothetical protein|uniref:hypothetical protein n=1 Tax=Devosia sp. TaxID=1871048 RepID=UPI002DDCDDE8|nr:hypothetical protein [Devosia sp.]HEV2516507.1 hypothetical protein [Devosia sp.]